MDETRRAHYRKTLLDAMGALDEEDALGRDGQNTVTLDQQAVGRLSRMDALQQQAMSRATQARRNASRMKLAAALARLDDGEYGYCLDCGEAIAEARLALDPATPKCTSCATG